MLHMFKDVPLCRSHELLLICSLTQGLLERARGKSGAVHVFVCFTVLLGLKHLMAQDIPAGSDRYCQLLQYVTF